MAKIKSKLRNRTFIPSKRFFQSSNSKLTRGLSSPLKNFAANFAKTEKIAFNDVTKPILRKLPLKLKNQFVVFNDFNSSYFFKQNLPVCRRRKLRRQVLFALGFAGRIKVRFARWTNYSKIKCKG